MFGAAPTQQPPPSYTASACATSKDGPCSYGYCRYGYGNGNLDTDTDTDVSTRKAARKTAHGSNDGIDTRLQPRVKSTRRLVSD